MGQSVTLGGKTIRTDELGEMYTYFYKDRDGRAAFPIDSFFDVYSGKIPAAKYADKIVLIGATATGVGTSEVTPISAQMNPVTTLAHSVSSILQQHFFVAPAWGPLASFGVYLAVALYLMLGLPRLRAGMAAIVSAVLLAALFATHLALMTGPGLWLQLMLPAHAAPRRAMRCSPPRTTWSPSAARRRPTSRARNRTACWASRSSSRASSTWRSTSSARPRSAPR